MTDAAYPTTDDLRLNLTGITWIRPDHPHPTAGPLEPPIGIIQPEPDGDWAWTTWDARTPLPPRHQWNRADTQHQAAEELLTDHLTTWQHEHDRDLDWEHWGQRPTYGQGAVA